MLTFRRLLFKKVTITHKDCFLNIKGSICNIPVEANAVVYILPRGADSYSLIFVKFKRKLSIRGHVNLEVVLPEAVQLALVCLKQNNLFYHGIRIDIV